MQHEHRASLRTLPLLLLAASGACIGLPPPLPNHIRPQDDQSSSSTGDSDTGSTADSSSGPNAICGDGEAQGQEECDGADWQGETCQSLGYGEGTIACSDCLFDTSECGPPPGVVLVPGGSFVMGSSDSPEQSPVRQLTVDAVWIDAAETTVEDYIECIEHGGCADSPDANVLEQASSGHERHPVTKISWFEARSYCEWRGKRLPTEAEWEKAARGTDTRSYPWGDTPAPNCTHTVMNAGMGGGCGSGSTMVVGSTLLGASPYGAQDMAGNAYEWVSDWYGPYPEILTDNPTGPPDGTERILRGGSWNDSDPNDLRVSHRVGIHPASISNAIGFRCAQTP